MKAAWVSDTPTWDLVIVEDKIVVASDHDLVGLDELGRERWRRTFERRPNTLTRCGRGVAFQMQDRWAATQLAAVDVDGRDMWRYEREWALTDRGLTGDHLGVVLFGHDYGPVVDPRWVGLDAATGACMFDVPRPVDSMPEIAGSWLIAPVDGGSGGLMRTDRDASHPMLLTSWTFAGAGGNEELVLLRTDAEPVASEIVAIELASGRERWRAPGGKVLNVGVHERHAAWAAGRTDDALPVVHELATGTRIWTGDKLPALQGRGYYRCTLGPDALVCYCGHKQVAYYSLHSQAPLNTREWEGDAPSVSRFWGKYFLEAGKGKLVCWELA